MENDIVKMLFFQRQRQKKRWKIKTISGAPPLSFKAKAGALKDYKIYGNTVDVESVGDRTENLFDKSGSQYGNNLHWVPARGLVYSDTYYGSPIMDVTGLNTITRSYTGTSANYFLTSDLSQFVNVSNVGTVNAGATVNVPDGYTKYVFNIPNTIRPDSIMVNSGSTAFPYEPYGYRVPVTVANGTDTETTNIYLSEQIRKVGNEAEYVDYKEQKQHRVRKNLLPTIKTTYSKNGIIVRTGSDGIPKINGTTTATIFLKLNNNRSYPFDTILNGCPKGGSMEGYSLRAPAPPNVYTDLGNGILIPANTNMYIEIRIQIGTECNNLEFKPMIRKADITDDTYELYIDNIDVDVDLPELPTLAGTNVLTVGTEVQPSGVEITGRIKKGE